MPTEPLTSRFDEPSTGSVHTTRAFAPPASPISIGSGASSEITAAQARVSRSAATMTSWPHTSSFLTWSPVTLLPPA